MDERVKKRLIIILIAFLTYIALFLVKNNFIIFIYQAILLVFIIFTRKVSLSISKSLLILIALLVSITPIVNSNTVSIYMSNFTYIIDVLFLIYVLNTKNDHQDSLKKDTELYLLLVYPIIFIMDIINYFGSNNKISKEVIKKNNNSYLIQIVIGLLIGVPIFAITLLILSFIELEFLTIFNLSIIPSIVISFCISLILVHVIQVAQKKGNKYDSFILEVSSKDNEKLSKYKVITNVVLLSTLPLQLLFVLYEFSKLFLQEILYGELVANAFTLINTLVFLNLMLLISVYLFYKQSDKVSKYLRVIFIIVNMLLLSISTGQVLSYINNFNALTYKRYYALIIIALLLIINLVFLIKTVNKKFSLLNSFYGFAIITVILTMSIDADSVIYKYNTSQVLTEEEKLDTELLTQLYPRWYVNEYNVLDN